MFFSYWFCVRFLFLNVLLSILCFYILYFLGVVSPSVCIIAYFLFVYNFNYHYHRVETQLNFMNKIS
jgi:hypothetical protein